MDEQGVLETIQGWSFLFCRKCSHLLDNHVGGCPACRRDGRECESITLPQLEHAYHQAGLNWSTGLPTST